MKMTKAISIASAAVLAASMAVSVSAADYADTPNYILPEVQLNPGGADGSTPAPSTDNAASSSSSAAVSTVVSENNVERAIANSKPVKVSYKEAAIKSNAIAALAKKADAVLKVETKRYTMEIASDSVTEAKDIDLGIKITKNSKKGALILKTNQKGEYGCTIKMSIPAKIYEQSGVDLDKASVYIVKDGKAVKLGAVELDDNGNIILEISEGGQIIIL